MVERALTTLIGQPDTQVLLLARVEDRLQRHNKKAIALSESLPDRWNSWLDAKLI